MENLENNPIILSAEEKIKLFSLELSKMHSDKNRQFVESALTELVPNYFFNIAASSTGKYHPSYALGSGGLVRHTQAATRIAIGLFEIMNISEEMQDAVIAALILHDSFKHGEYYSKYTIASHPVVAERKITEYAETFEDIDMLCFANTIGQLVLTHMGKWNTDWKTHKEFAPKPSNSIQSFVHMCDYLASRKYLEFIFEEKI